MPHVPPQVNQPPPTGGSYGPSYGGGTSTFASANNYSTGCLLDGRPADCNRVRMALANGQANPPGVGAHPLFLNIGPGASPISRFGYQYGNDSRGTEYVYTGWTEQEGGSKVPAPPQRSAESIKCDERLANIFGRGYKYGTRFATDFDPQTKGNPRGRNRLTAPGESPLDGYAHLFGSATGDGSPDALAFTPDGYSRSDGFPTSLPGPAGGTEPQNELVVFYAEGALKKYGYSEGLAISFVHIGPTDRRRVPLPPNRSIRNELGSVSVGVIGGFGNSINVGGGGPGNIHTHMRFRKAVRKKGSKTLVKGAPVDPRAVFCSDLGFK